MEPDERMTLEANGLAEKPVGERVPRLPACSGCGVQQLDGSL